MNDSGKKMVAEQITSKIFPQKIAIVLFCNFSIYCNVRQDSAIPVSNIFQMQSLP